MNLPQSNPDQEHIANALQSHENPPTCAHFSFSQIVGNTYASALPFMPLLAMIPTDCSGLPSSPECAGTKIAC